MFSVELVLHDATATVQRANDLQHAVETVFSADDGFFIRLAPDAVVWIPFVTAFSDMLEAFLPYISDVAATHTRHRYACAFSNDYDVQFDWYATWSGEDMHVDAEWIEVAGKKSLPSTWSVQRSHFVREWARVLDAIHLRTAALNIDDPDEFHLLREAMHRSSRLLRKS